VRRIFSFVLVGISLVALGLVSAGAGDAMFAYLSTSARFNRRSATQPVVSTVPCAKRTTKDECKQGAVERACIWDAVTEKCEVEPQTCIDDDGGLDFYRASATRGRAAVANAAGDVFHDFCEYALTGSGQLSVTEFYCAPDGLVQSLTFHCPKWCVNGACQKTASSAGGGKANPQLTQRLLELSPGGPPNNSITLLSYESEISFSLRSPFLLQSFTPSVTACPGTCVYEVILRDAGKNVLAKMTGSAQSGAVLSAGLTLPIPLKAGISYNILQFVKSDRPMTIRTTGPTSASRDMVNIITSKSDGADYRAWGTMVITIMGMFTK
jgi:hypothetical protein